MFGITMGEKMPAPKDLRKEEIKKLLSDFQTAEDILLTDANPDKNRLQMTREAKTRLENELAELEGEAPRPKTTEENHHESFIEQRKVRLGGTDEAFNRKIEDELRSEAHI